MADASIVYDGVASSSGISEGLFAGKRFWFSRTVPQSKRYKQLVESNGGSVVPFEKQADILITDHAKKNPSPNTYSYQYVEKSVQNGKLENLEDHRAGPAAGDVRPVGSTHISARAHRVPFSAEDDRILRGWLGPYEKAGGSISGNKIYQELEAKYPHHTYQSWRNRYLKVVRKVTRPVTPPVAESAEATATHDERSKDDRASTSEQTPRRRSGPIFTADDKANLLDAAENIMSETPSKRLASWSEFAKTTDRSSEEWQLYFEQEVLPEYYAQRSKRKSGERSTEQPFSLRTPRGNSSTPSKRKERVPQATPSRGQQVSPSFQPEPPTIPPTEALMTGGLRRSARNTNDRETSRNGISRKSPPQGKRKRDNTPTVANSHASPESKRVRSPKRRRTTHTVAVEIPTAPKDTARSRASLPSFSHHPSAQLLGSSDFIQSPKTTRRREASVSESSHSDHTPHFEDAPQFQEDAQAKETSVNLDMDIPQPPDSTENSMVDLGIDLLFPLLPDEHDDTTIQPNNEEDQPLQIEEWINSRLKSSKANEEQLIQALRCCSMEPHLADKVLSSLVSGKGIPTNKRGVWTAEDDECLQTGQSREIEKLIHKHGDDFMQKRGNYFKLLNEV